MKRISAENPKHTGQKQRINRRHPRRGPGRNAKRRAEPAARNKRSGNIARLKKKRQHAQRVMRILVGVIPEKSEAQNDCDDYDQRKRSGDGAKSLMHAEPFDSIEARASILPFVPLASRRLRRATKNATSKPHGRTPQAHQFRVSEPAIRRRSEFCQTFALVSAGETPAVLKPSI